MVGWIDEDGIPRGGFPDKITPVRELFDERLKPRRIKLLKNEDPERLTSVTGTYLADKYPVTNCDFTQLMWDDIPKSTSYTNKSIKRVQEEWISRKNASLQNKQRRKLVRMRTNSQLMMFSKQYQQTVKRIVGGKSNGSL